MNGRDLFGYLWLVPAAFPIFLFLIYPIFYNAVLAFQGFPKNFLLAFEDPVFQISLRNSLLFALTGATLTLGLALLIAIIVTSRESSFGMWAIILTLLVWVTPEIVTAITWSWMLHSKFGIVNWVLIWAGLLERGIPWLGHPQYAPILIVFLITWRLLPFLTLLFVCGILSIPAEYLEAAKVDGLKFRYIVRYILIPALRYPIIIAYILVFVWFMNDTAMIMATTGGGPFHLTETVATLIYKTGFNYFKFEVAAAMSFTQFLILLVICILF
ncbi:MAG: sugar ABC transporter permease, partial [Candidatus Bathyarchaeia archaeon]